VNVEQQILRIGASLGLDLLFTSICLSLIGLAANIARLVGIIIYNKTQSDLEYFGRLAFGNETAGGGRGEYTYNAIRS
jgi:hypothetical protein